MRDRNAAFVGCDIGDKFTELCVVDRTGAVIETRRVRTTKPTLVQAIGKHRKVRVVIEAGTHSRWVEEALTAAGHDVIVANPRQIQSGESDPQKHISKAGNEFLRRLLVQCAHRLLGAFGGDCDLRTWGLTLCERGGAAAKKRAIVAVARKLAVVMHRVWVTGQSYDPHFNSASA